MFGLPEKKRKNAAGESGMLLTSPGEGAGVSLGSGFRAGCKLLWVSRKKDAEGKPLSTRAPQERTQVFSIYDGFEAAGRQYKHFGELTKKKLSDNLARDRYGREVFMCWERFPCFDSFDAMYENRFYRWYFLREGDRLTRVYYADEDDEIYVTEDVENLEHNCWDEMLEQGYAVEE